MSKSRGLVICITNDITYDQRVLKIAGSLQSAYKVPVTIVGRMQGRFEENHSNDLIYKRLDCFFSSGPIFYLEYNIRLFFFLIGYRNSFGTICCCDVDTIAGGMTAARILNKNATYDAHEWFAEVPELLGKNVKKKIWTAIEKYGIKISKQRYTVGPMLASKLSEIYNVPFEVVRNVPIVNEKMELPADKENIVLYQGAINKGRGLEALLEASRLLPQYEFVLVGEGDIKDQLMTIKSDQHLENVSFINKQTPEQLKAFTRKAKFGYNLLESNSLSYYYSLANKFFDYAAQGVVSINSKLPEYILLIGKYQHALELNDLDPGKIARLICDISEEQRLILAGNGMQMSLENNWQLESQKLISIYKPYLG